ncbi:hypothetical protein BCY86_08830 [Pajaroellobacter abortibovis]|uniref:Uncharacterized protein n=2 Tax=Pajaroellobacter abortibovis TaxID=1882918 RepID=A0A1L6MZA0_9BACT|nr:hypothetical protein BCY86_08830 [Pajaroellobacter abortibovis]
MLGGLKELDTSVKGKTRDLSTYYEAFAVNIRLAPADPLPFIPSVPQLSSPFRPLVLEPVGYGADGAFVFGWRISDYAARS